MGACFQAPHAAPGQKPMEMKLVAPSYGLHDLPAESALARS